MTGRSTVAATLCTLSLLALAGSRVTLAVTPVSSCGTLSTPGETYVLTTDIATSGNCFWIQADGITFDGQGHTLTSSNPVAWAVSVFGPHPATGVVIQNVVTDGFGRGVVLAAGGANTVLSTSHTNSAVGIQCASSDGNTLVGNVTDAGLFGVHLAGCSNSHLEGNVASSNGLFGLYLTGDSNDNVIQGNTFDLNLFKGVDIKGAARTLVTDNDIRGNPTGISLNTHADDNVITGNRVRLNNQGIYLQVVQNNLIKGNVLTDNENGIRIESSDANLVQGNTVVGQLNFGILFQVGSSLNTVVGNTVSSNLRGIAITDGSLDNLVYNNSFVGNATQVWRADPGNLFHLAAPVGGNYWQDFDQPGEGCFDATPVDGFCDAPFVFTDGQDDLPWTARDGWLEPAARIAVLIEGIEELVADGVLSGGQGGSLINKLDTAVDQLDRGQEHVAINQLMAFINQVNALISAGILTAAEGEELIGAANAVIDKILAS